MDIYIGLGFGFGFLAFLLLLALLLLLYWYYRRSRGKPFLPRHVVALQIRPVSVRLPRRPAPVYHGQSRRKRRHPPSSPGRPTRCQRCGHRLKFGSCPHCVRHSRAHEHRK